LTWQSILTIFFLRFQELKKISKDFFRLKSKSP
jgi:hypothetical protein